jgi:hypothetical protein
MAGTVFYEAIPRCSGASLAVILVMAVVSGGDAIFGELPFTIAGFLISS